MVKVKKNSEQTMKRSNPMWTVDSETYSHEETSQNGTKKINVNILFVWTDTPFQVKGCF